MKQKSLRHTVDEMRRGKVEPVYFLNGNDYFLQSLFVDEVMVALTKDEAPEKSYFSAESVDYTLGVYQESLTDCTTYWHVTAIS